MSDSPFMRRVAKRDSGHHGRKAESSIAKRLGGTQQPGSGALAGAKGDVSLRTMLVENKATTHESFSVRQDWLHKIYQEALERSKIPALAFQFVNSIGNSNKNDRWVCIPEHLLAELMESGS